MARRYEALSEEISELDAHLERLVAQAAPELVCVAARFRLAGDPTDVPTATK